MNDLFDDLARGVHEYAKVICDLQKRVEKLEVETNQKPDYGLFNELRAKVEKLEGKQEPAQKESELFKLVSKAYRIGCEYVCQINNHKPKEETEKIVQEIRELAINRLKGMQHLYEPNMDKFIKALQEL